MKPGSKILAFLAAFLVIAPAFSPANAASQIPVESDARIRTVVYNDNEVYTFITRHGFQSHIEFGLDENIETISVGDAIGWQITPAGRRIFVKPLQRNGITNLTVITNRHSYQFELVATDSSGRSSNHAYVMRFYYPDLSSTAQISIEDRTRGSLRPVSPTSIPEIPPPPVYTPPPIPAPPLPAGTFAPPEAPPAIPASEQIYNFDYTLTGPGDIAPTKIYDDGRSTFFELPPTAAGNLEFALVTPDGTEVPVLARQNGNKMVIDQIAGKITIRKDSSLICIYNERILSLPPTASLGR